MNVSHAWFLNYGSYGNRQYNDEEGPGSSEEEEERAVGALSKEMGEAVAAAVIEFVYKPP